PQALSRRVAVFPYRVGSGRAYGLGAAFHASGGGEGGGACGHELRSQVPGGRFLELTDSCESAGEGVPGGNRKGQGSRAVCIHAVAGSNEDGARAWLQKCDRAFGGRQTAWAVGRRGVGIFRRSSAVDCSLIGLTCDSMAQCFANRTESVVGHTEV